MKAKTADRSTGLTGTAMSPLAMLTACRRPRIRIALPTTLPALDAKRRKYLRELRAAEFASWQASGGDFVRASSLGSPAPRTAA